MCCSRNRRRSAGRWLHRPRPAGRPARARTGDGDAWQTLFREPPVRRLPELRVPRRQLRTARSIADYRVRWRLRRGTRPAHGAAGCVAEEIARSNDLGLDTADIRRHADRDLNGVPGQCYVDKTLLRGVAATATATGRRRVAGRRANGVALEVVRGD